LGVGGVGEVWGGVGVLECEGCRGLDSRRSGFPTQ